MIKVAIEAAKAGAQVGTTYFKNIPTVSFKTDKSPVTKADVEAEKAIRKVITKNFPSHGIIGEELPPINPKSRFQWVIDPIDGTRDYVRKIPFWATYVALMDTKEPIIGVVFLPILGDLMIATKGKGAYLNDKKACVSTTKNLYEAYISHGQIKRFVQMDKIKQLENLCNKVRAARSYGNFGLKSLIEGNIDVTLEAYGALYDFAAPSLIVKEAGGEFTDFSGNESMTNKNGVFSNKILHKQVIKILNSK